MTDLVDYEAHLRQMLGALPFQERAMLVDILTSPDVDRAKMIGRLHLSSASGVAELLMDSRKIVRLASSSWGS